MGTLDQIPVSEGGEGQGETCGTDADRIVIYDGDCRMCVTAKEGLEKLGGDADVRFVPYQTEEAARRLGMDYRPGRPDAAFLVEPDGTVHPGLDAFIPLLPGITGGRVLLALLKIPFIRPLGYLAYRVVARNRYRWFGTVERRTEQTQKESETGGGPKQ